ncbi:MAG: protein kinase [Phycisphaerales bacterium]
MANTKESLSKHSVTNGRGIRQLFDYALTRSPAERERFFDETCGEDHVLRENLVALLEAADQHSPVDPEDPDHRIGTIIPSKDGGWKIQEWLGAGGSGNVYRAHWVCDTGVSGSRIAAIKILNRRGASLSDVTRFRCENQALQEIDHPGVVKILDTCFAHPRQENDEHWLALEIVENSIWITEANAVCSDHDPLWSVNSKSDSPTPMSLFLDVCDILGVVHMMGIVHLDLKPGNLLVDNEGRVHVIDFGIAKITRTTHDESTDVGLRGHDELMMGTPAYMAPEQVDMSLGPVSPRTDVHALGVIVFQMLADRMPFEVGDNLLSAVQVIRHVPPADLRKFLPDIPESVVAVIERSLDKIPKRRPANALVFASELRRALEIEKRSRPRRYAPIVGITAAIILMTMMYWTWIATPKAEFAPELIMVPNDFSTIQSAIDAIADGGTILVRPGTYNENIDFGVGMNRNFVLASTDGPLVTVINGSNEEKSVVFIGNYFDDRTRIEGFTVTGGRTGNRSPEGFRVGGGIYVRLNSVAIVDCHFIDNRSTFGGNIYAKHYTGSIHGCLFSEGYANAEGGNAFFFRGQTVVSGSQFNHGFTTGNGGGMKVASGCHKFVSCVVEENHSERGGGIFYVEFDGEPAELQFIDCLVYRNTAIDGGGILSQKSSRGPITRRTLVCENKPDEFVGPVSEVERQESGYCWGDLDFDGVIDADDSWLLLQAWGESDQLVFADFDRNNRVDHSDLANLVAHWGPCDK